MADRRVVLFITNEDRGQTNVVSAVAHELLTQGAVDIHIASWGAFEHRVTALSEQVQKENPTRQTPHVQFHTLPIGSMFTAWVDKGGIGLGDLPHPPGVKAMAHFKILAPPILAPYSPEEHIELYEACSELAKNLKPDLIVLDPYVSPAHDMCRMGSWKYAVLNPCTLVPALAAEQPWLAGFWKYPALSTGFPYPLPFNLIGQNLYCLWSCISLLWSGPIKTINAARKAYGIQGTFPAFTPITKDIQHICPSLPEIDLPVASIPPNVHFVGPILLAAAPVHETDPELHSWLQQRPTVLASLGTLMLLSTETVTEMCIGFRLLLDARPDVQILWKLKPKKGCEQDIDDVVDRILGKDISEGRVRVEKWLTADPLAILKTGNVVCSVHHGGANSYFETAWAGIPQVILPHWYDCFDYAVRAQFLGIGVYGNDVVGHKVEVDVQSYTSPTMVEGQEFGAAMLKVMGDKTDDAKHMRKRAGHLGEICRKSGGRVEAARIITELALAE